ncbi:hypothetical protein ACH4F6_38190 [Streptomyces sp. NPDC017936]|uniref:hypothetical protein n=1 Tax=Streptomyces sp. NPDC017936 TaxID=3365016 RepID=UPI00379AB9C8
MSAADIDRRLRDLLDSLSPEQLDRLAVLVHARTSKTPPPPTDGPQAYRGIPVPEVLRPNWDQPEAGWWSRGADAALNAAVPLLLALADTKPCESDSLGACLTHDYPPPLCADGEAQRLLKATEGEG